MALRKKVLGLTALAFATTLGFGVAGINASAAESTQTAKFEMVAGAQVRTIDPSGIRFLTDVNEAYKTELAKTYSTENYTWVWGTELTFTDVEENTWTVDAKTEKWIENDTRWYTTLVGIPDTDYLTEITAESYVKIYDAENTLVDTKTVSNAQTRSIAYSASWALNDGYNQEILYTYTKAIPNTSVELDKESESVVAGTEIQLNANAQPAGYGVAWRSSDTSVATVDKNGKVTALKAGETTITATLGNASDSYELEVTVALGDWAAEYGITGANIKSVSETGVTFEKGVTGHGQAGKPANADGHLGYLTYNGSYGAGDYVVVDFTGDNMPMIKFFGQTATDDVVNVTGTKTTAEQGVVLMNAYRDETGAPEAAFKNNDLWLLAAHGVSNIGFEDKGSSAAGNYRNVNFDTSTEKYNAVALAARPDTSYRMIFGFEKFDTTGATINFAIYNLDTYTLEWERTFSVGTMYSTDDYANYTYTGLIQLFGHYGKEITLDKVFPIYENTNIATVKETVKPVAPDYLGDWMTANNVKGSGIANSTKDLGLTFVAGDDGRGNDGAGAAREAGSLGYLAYQGEYGVKDYVVVDFTGDNMPAVKFFGQTIDDDYINGVAAKETAEQGVVFLNAFRKRTGTAEDAFCNDRMYMFASYGVVNVGYEDKANQVQYRKVGFGADFGALDIANSTTKYRMIIGFEEVADEAMKINWAVINLDTGVVTQQTFSSGPNVTTADYDYTGYIQLFGSYGKAITLDKVYAIEEDAVFAELLTKYTPAV